MFNNIDTLHTIYIVTLTAAIFMAVVTIVLFFVFDIRHVIARKFGFSERKAIKQIAANSYTGNLNSKYNQTMKDQVFTDTGSLRKKQTPQELMGLTPPKPVSQSEELFTGGLSAATSEYGDSSTTALAQNRSEEATTLLGANGAYDSESATTMLGANGAYDPDGATTMLGENGYYDASDPQTTLLDPAYGVDSQTTVLNGPQTFTDVHFTVTRQITMIHTEESI